MTFPLIESKLTPPSEIRPLLPRSHLFDLVESGLGKKSLTISTAPAGYGKSTLASQWAKQSRWQSCWLSLDNGDNNIEVFLQYFIASLSTTLPGFQSKIPSFIEARALPPVNYLADTVIAEIGSIHTPVSFIFDDYHSITDKDVQSFILRILSQNLTNFHIVLLSREKTKLPLAKMKIMQIATILGMDKLAFSVDETALVLNQGRFKDLDLNIASLICERTEGWIAGIRFFELALGDHEEAEADKLLGHLSSQPYEMVEFFIEEVLSHLPAHAVLFLYISALLDRFCAPLCDAVLIALDHPPDSHSIIEKFEDNNLFIFALDSRRFWHRYHHLFSTMLRERSETVLSSEQRRNIYIAAGTWFNQEGLHEESIKYLLQGGEVNLAATVLEVNIYGILQHDTSSRYLQKLLDFFPETAIEQYPVVPFAHSLIYNSRSDFPRALEMLDKAEELMNTLPQPDDVHLNELIGDIAAIRSSILFWQGKYTKSLPLALKALAHTPRTHFFTYCSAVIYAAGSYFTTGRVEQAFAMLEDEVLIDIRVGAPTASRLMLGILGLHCLGANPLKVLENAQRIFAINEKHAPPGQRYAASYGYYFMGLAAYEMNLLDKAEHYFTQGSEKGAYTTSRAYHDMLLALAHIAAINGDLKKAKSRIHEAYTFATQIQDSYSMQITQSMQARINMSAGEYRANGTWSTLLVTDSNKYWIEYPSLTRAEILVNDSRNGDVTLAGQLLEQGVAQAQKHNSSRLAFMFKAVQAVLLQQSNKHEQALSLLGQLVNTASQLGLVRTFVDRGPIMADLLRVLADKSQDREYINSILRAFPDCEQAQRSNASQAPLYEPAHLRSEIAEPLTLREGEVLCLLKKRYTYKEVAQKLSISPETVKKHACSVYRKMDISGKHELLRVD